MRVREAERARQERPDDVGTLWMLRHRGRTARCALLAWKTTWEVRVLVDREIFLTEHCNRTDEAFSLAERWKHRMIEEGWQQIVPRRPEHAA